MPAGSAAHALCRQVRMAVRRNGSKLALVLQAHLHAELTHVSVGALLQVLRPRI